MDVPETTILTEFLAIDIANDKPSLGLQAVVAAELVGIIGNVTNAKLDLIVCRLGDEFLRNQRLILRRCRALL